MTPENGRAGSGPQAGTPCFRLRGRLDKLINLCLLRPALFLDMQTLPSSKARGIRWADRTSRVWLLPGPEAWPDACGALPLTLGSAGGLAAYQGGAPPGPGLLVASGRRLTAPLGPGGGPILTWAPAQSWGGPGSQNFGINFPSNPLPFPGLASPGKF